MLEAIQLMVSTPHQLDYHMSSWTETLMDGPMRVNTRLHCPPEVVERSERNMDQRNITDDRTNRG
jgi:hypothetical protein